MSKIKWWVWERPATIHLVHIAASTCAYPLKLNYGKCYADKFYGFFNKDIVRWICDLDQMKQNGKTTVLKFLEKPYSQEKRELWDKATEKLRYWFKKLEQIKIKELNDAELLNYYSQFTDIYARWWSVTQVAELISYGGEEILKDNLSEGDYKKYFNVLVTPTKKSYLNVEEEKLFDIVKLAKEKGINSKVVEERVKQHVKEYHWVHNNFHSTIRLNKAYFKKEISEYIKNNVDIDQIVENNKKRLEKAKEEKESVINKLKIKKEIRTVIWLLDEFCHLQDQRKSIDMQANEYLDNFCKEVAERRNVDYKLFRFALPEQIKKILSEPQQFIEKTILERIKQQSEKCVIIFNDTNYNSEIYVGEDAIKKEDEVLGVDSALNEVNEIVGVCASTGRYTGTVKIILNSRDANKLKEGDVLVTTMTSPDFIIAMKKASAIITDEGGITSHAAIVSRELGIPCIIGTRIATKVLKDGDVVEVKANHGVVRKIK